jgi:hypothetical protein
MSKKERMSKKEAAEFIAKLLKHFGLPALSIV